MDGRVDYVCAIKPTVEQVPAPLVRWFFSGPHDDVCRPIHRLQYYLETNCLQPLAGYHGCSIEEWSVVDLEYHDRCPIVARLLQKLARLEQVVFDDRVSAYIRRIRAATRVHRVAGPGVVRLSDRPMKICHLVHRMEEGLARLLVVEGRVKEIRPEPALLPKRIHDKRLQIG